MKDIISIWSHLAGRRYTSVNTNSNTNPTNGCHVNDIEDISDTNVRDPRRNFRRKSSVVINQFFNAALPVHRDGRPRWSKCEFHFIFKSSIICRLISGKIIITNTHVQNAKKSARLQRLEPVSGSLPHNGSFVFVTFVCVLQRRSVPLFMNCD